MKISNIVLVAGLCFASSSGAGRLAAQETSTAHAVVTATTKSAENLTNLPQQTISLQENRKSQPVTGWVPLRGARSGLQLVVLLDDASRGNLGLQLNDLKSFLTALPPNAQVALGYMRNGAPNLVQGFTTNHALAAQGLRLPIGAAGINGSPYFCLSALAKHWPGGGDVRREVIMVTDGIDRYSGERGFDPEDPYVQAAISDAQRAGLIVYSIFYRGVGRADRGFMSTDTAQNYLTQVSGDTGGKVYLEGFGNPVSFAPFLSDIQHRLQNQYELSFVSSSKSGLQSIKLKTSQRNTSLQYPARVPVGGVNLPE